MVFATYEAAQREINARDYTVSFGGKVNSDSIYKVSNPQYESKEDLYILAENLAQAALMACNEYGITIVTGTGNLAKIENRP